MSKIREIIDNLTTDTNVDELTTQLVESSEEFDNLELELTNARNEIDTLNSRITELKELNYDLMKKCIDSNDRKKEEPKNNEEKEITFNDIMESYED